MPYFIPHSENWFEALECVNPQQAEITRRVISLTGDSDVCSICGDAAVSDYEVVGVSFAADMPATIRLCSDCKSIRQKMHGEQFKLIA